MTPKPKPKPLGASSIARIAGNILGGMAADPRRNAALGEQLAETALRLAVYIAKRAKELEQEMVDAE